MNKKSKFIKLLTAFSSLTLLSACLSSVTTPGMNDQVHRNSVQLVRFSHVIKAESDATSTLSQKTIADLDNFLNSTNVGYGDVLMVDTAYQATDDRVLEIKKYVKKRGHEYAGKTLLGGKPAAGDIILYVERHVVTTPNCGNWPNEPGSALINNPSSFHGCSNTANLGLMVANPRDLISGQQGHTTTPSAVNAINASSNNSSDSSNSQAQRRR